MFFGRFYLDKEKDMIVTLEKKGTRMFYVLSTPNHHTGNLISNLAKLCGLTLSTDKNGLKVIEGEVPCYIDAYNQPIYIFRLGGTKVANIFPNGRIEMKASIPSISKTLMSQTKDYQLDIQKTIIKTYIFDDCKFHADLHTHMNANLSPDMLIALGISHQIRYPLYYIKKLELKCSKAQETFLLERRRKVAEKYKDSDLTGKYLDRKIDDNTFINLADLILNNIKNAAYNIPRIRASLSVLKDGQAVFTNLEKVYLYRYVFTKGVADERPIVFTEKDVLKVPDEEIRKILQTMMKDKKHPVYKNNTLFQDKLVWIARSYLRQGVHYAEISDTTLVKPNEAGRMLEMVHEVMPAIYEETGVVLRFLAGIRRIPLTLVKDRIQPNDYLLQNLKTLRAVAVDPYVAGSDILGEEINDIRLIQPVIQEIVSIAEEDPSFVVRIHAGENDSLRDNVASSVACVLASLKKHQKMPHVRIGHGLYTSNLRSAKGRHLLEELRKNKVVLEFQITSNVRLNNLSKIDQHPLKQYLHAGVFCVQGTDGCGIYGTDSIDEELSLEKLLDLSHEDMLRMRRAEDTIVKESLKGFSQKQQAFEKLFPGGSIQQFYDQRIEKTKEAPKELILGEGRQDSYEVFKDRIRPLPEGKVPIILAGGSFNNDKHVTKTRAELKQLIDDLLNSADPDKVCFVVGYRLNGYEKYLVSKNQGRFEIFTFVPATVTKEEAAKVYAHDVNIRVAIEPSSMGLYKSIAYEIFRESHSILLALDGNSALANLMQEAKNGRKECRIFVNPHSKMIREKAQSIQGYITFLKPDTSAKDILAYL